ncbi:MAG: LysM peptidoglycan-binding domain-containing protein [Pseudonocardiaceae bacterium]
MKASAELRTRPAVRIAARGATMAPSGLRPAPPAPVPPLAPPTRQRQVDSPACYLADSASLPARAVRPLAWWYGQVMRVVVAAALTLGVVAGLSWLGQGTSPGPSVPGRTVIVQVGAGETVWDVAQRVAPRFDQRAVVEQIRHLNGLVASAVEPGQQLRVPDGR